MDAAEMMDDTCPARRQAPFQTWRQENKVTKPTDRN
jgi:hypothetical protein